jgi:hypothetical protein
VSVDGMSCAACPAGEIATDLVTCTSCAAGEYTTDGVTCDACPKGQTDINNHTACGCDPGQGSEVLDQQATSPGSAAQPWGNSPMAQVFTAGVTGHLTDFAYAGVPCYASSNKPCGFTLELRAVDGNGNPGALLWSGRGQEPPQLDSPKFYAWSTTALANPPMVNAGTQYAIVVTPDWWEEFVFGTGSAGYAVAWNPSYNIWERFPDDLLFQTFVTPQACP